ncbi:uncharacterized protein LOC119896609 [Micropterus salmoides]|uniref:uncharacterized protein LOC119896609 n=1 Tax=Micropterus salmoides TaxID=27706 RepID=UPI0018ECF39B|nr:uncharacterized protein LOC119896609 [Micropterus salmoides]XP_038566031.1 uncharacterized protein LOC119896609 [Micropterus salmoides]
MQASKEEEKSFKEMQRTLWLLRVKRSLGNTCRNLDQKEELIKKCRNQSVLQWLRDGSESRDFSQLVDMFNFLKERIDVEEKKNHSNSVDITFVAHGAIGDFMIPASCLLPLPSITDVLLYSPWNCTSSADVVYGVATGRIRPQHRVFKCDKDDGCLIPDGEHRPVKLPNYWNSMKTAGDQLIPNITVSPLKPPEDGVWERYESLTKKYGEPERNRIVIPFILPAERTSLQSVPFSVVCLAASLVLLSSRFQATLHLSACLGDRSAGQKFDKDYLQTQYACAVDSTVMTPSADMFTLTWRDAFRG